MDQPTNAPDAEIIVRVTSDAVTIDPMTGELHVVVEKLENGLSVEVSGGDDLRDIFRALPKLLPQVTTQVSA